AQRYRIVLSKPFITSVPAEGTLPAFSNMQIPIRFDPAFLTNVENIAFTAIGSITVLDSDFSDPGILGCQLIGMIGEMVAFEVRDPKKTIKFPDILPNEVSKRQILFRNKSSYQAFVEFDLESLLGQGSESANPFSLPSKSISLKPYELAMLEVSFRTSTGGEFKSKLSMSYVYTVGTGRASTPSEKRQASQIFFSCASGIQEITRQPEYLSFGDVTIGDTVQQNLIIQNSGPIKANLLLAPPASLSVEDRALVIDKGRARLEFPIRYSPISSNPVSTSLAFTVGHITHSIPIIGLGGTTIVRTNLGNPLLLANITNIAKMTPPPESVFDCGILAFGDSRKIPLEIFNDGTLDFIVNKVSTVDEKLVQLEPHYTTFVGSPDEATAQSFGKPNLNNDEIDLDNFIYVMENTKQMAVGARSKNAQFYKRRASSVVATDRRASKLFSKAPEIQAGPTYGGFDLQDVFPNRIRPCQGMKLVLKVNADSVGPFMVPVVSKINRFRRDPIHFVLWVKFLVLKALVLATKKIDFGICPVSKTKIVFTNEERVPIRWSIKYASSKAVPSDYFDEAYTEYLDQLRCPVFFFPSSGTLIGGGTQEVDLEFVASIPQADIFTLLTLQSGDYNCQDILIQATGASSLLQVEPKVLDYSTLRVGTKKTLALSIMNQGLLPCKFYLENMNNQFVGEPEQGQLIGGEEREALVTFYPTKVMQANTLLRVHCISKNVVPPVDIVIRGSASYPKLQIAAKVIDFGTALFKSVNKRRLEVQNIGAAEALIDFECNHADVTIDTSLENALQVLPNQTKTLTILYQPQVVERLSVKAFVKSSDNRGETFSLHIKGDVGIPKLTIIPKNAMESLDFGVMRLGKTYTKTFTIVNDGTIFISYKTFVEHIDVTHIGDAENSGRRVTNLSCPITVLPVEGRLGVGESVEISIAFAPTILADYRYEFRLAYEYQNLISTIHGVGGRSAPKIMSPFEDFDFELCRLGRVYQKTIQIYNRGNLGFYYHIRPEPANGDISVYAKERILIEDETEQAKEIGQDHSGEQWAKDLAKIGMAVLNPNGYCGPEAKIDVVVQFCPVIEAAVKQKFLFFHDEKFDSFTVNGWASSASLQIFDPHTKVTIDANSVPDIHIGVHPVNLTFNYNFELVNPGPFGVDFLLQPMSSTEYEVFPLRGYIEPNSRIPLALSFRPSSESKFHSNLRVIWEGESLKANIYGDGGVGRLEIKFVEERDLMLKSLDFGMVPFNTPCRKRFFLSNFGMVGVTAYLDTEHEDYTITLMGEPIESHRITAFKPNRDTFSTWDTSLKLYLPPGHAIQVGARYLPRNSTNSVGNITIRSDSGNFTVPLKGKGGTISLSHKGDLEFGDISCNYVYSRKITVTNGGSIPSNIIAAWLVVGHASETPEPFVNLAENYGSLDPRSQWARKQLCAEKKGIEFKSQLSGRDYWQLIVLMVRKDAAKNRISNPDHSTSTIADVSSRRGMGGAGSHHFKRRQMFYFLITSNQLTSQASLRVKPFIRVHPPMISLPSYGDAVFTVDMNLGSEDTFLATLVIKPDIPNSARYEIPLTATPKIVNILCDDTRILNFYRQPMGETESIVRKFTNLGHKDVPYKFLNPNSSLTIAPSKGLLKIGQSIMVTFSFKPSDESVQSGDVIFEPLFSHPIRFKMFGGGGYAKASLSRYRRFDFGHCMIGKDTVSCLPILNEGNALLHMVKFELQETDTFFRGQGWPTDRVSLFPGKSYNLPLVFNPHEENPQPGNLTISTVSETFDIELIGLGREAVLIVSKVALEFSECLMGNTYEQKLGLKNIGDVNYPVTCHLEKEFPDITFSPSTLTINPFSENFVNITYMPSHQTKTTVVLTLSSPYSSHKVPIMVHAGVAFIEFNQPELDFGMFERTTKPSLVMTMRNSGTVKTNFYIKDVVKPSIFSIEPTKGILYPKKSIDIKVTHTRHEVSNFNEKLAVKTDLIDKTYYVRVVGQCEETVLHEDEFAMANMGICPVLEPSSKAISFKNYGKFPLRFQIQSAYPLKVHPTEGEVAGGETGSVMVTWTPSGAYELRTQLVLSTNIGKYQILVRGKSMFPEVALSNNYIDFGVCATGYNYHQSFVLENRGKVKLTYSIPPCKEPSYVCSITQGVLEPKESIQVELLFTPRALGKLTGSLIVDCKGIHYKEVVLVGMGGLMDLDLLPLALNLERCPYGLKLYESIKVHNKGEVTLHVDFSSTKLEQG
ncbi:hypothetical protein HDU91_005601, partial [Kappamyces sp. JEL0680]